jgi:hypothetical protein
VKFAVPDVAIPPDPVIVGLVRDTFVSVLTAVRSVVIAELIRASVAVAKSESAVVASVCHVLSPRQYCPDVPIEIEGSLVARPGTVGLAAVPPRSPANWTTPFVDIVASVVTVE